MNSSQSPNWESLLVRLTAVAIGWFGNEHCRDQEAVLPGTGMSAVELAHEATVVFIKKQDQYRVKSDEDRFRIIKTIMRHDFLDLVKDGRAYKRTVILDSTQENDPSPLENLPDPNDGFVSAEAASVARSLYPLTNGEQELKDLIDAVAILGLYKKKDIADFLGKSSTEVTNMQKKLKYRREQRQKPTTQH